MRVLNWNLHGATGIGLGRQVEIVQAVLDLEIDVVLLQEVPLGTGFIARLREIGYTVTDPSDRAAGLWENKRRNATVIGSRLPMVELAVPEGLRFPRLFAAAKIGGVEIGTCHIPNASDYNKIARRLGFPKDIKVTHLERALAWIAGGPRRLLARDFNEPDYFIEGRAIGFKATRAGDTFRQRSFVDELMNSAKIKHLCAHLHEKGDEPSHWINSSPHPKRKGWFDHALSTCQDLVWTSEYLHELRLARNEQGKERYSDHSPLLITSI